MVIRQFSNEDIYGIINYCRDRQVQHFKYMGLDIDFRKDGEEILNPENKSILSKGSKIARDANSTDEYALREEQLANVIVEDPEGYERLITEGELGG